LVTGIHAQAPLQAVNAIIGDKSFVDFYGMEPGNSESEQWRIQLHLSYVEQQLRAQSTGHLSERQQANREKVLDLLHEYWMNGIFPSNYDYPGERRPCFIDKNGNICAVGYLIEKTAGIEVARAINEKHQYDFLLDMNEPVIEEWAAEHGLTVEECAMIQPAYNPPPASEITEVPLSQSYGIASGFLGGFNLAVNAINLSGRYGNNMPVSLFGLVTGTGQIIMGITNLEKDKVENIIGGGSRTTSYKAKNNLSYINIAMGTATLFTSALNLFMNHKIKDKRETLLAFTAIPAIMNLTWDSRWQEDCNQQ